MCQTISCRRVHGEAIAICGCLGFGPWACHRKGVLSGHSWPAKPEARDSLPVPKCDDPDGLQVPCWKRMANILTSAGATCPGQVSMTRASLPDRSRSMQVPPLRPAHHALKLSDNMGLKTCRYELTCMQQSETCLILM